ncbi:sulfatase-like hydrolase/transferase [Halopseudomonas bauzanensis]|uniref:Sulfatase n=1 Tax=Halopseudomonas bauzanensis TaxID=653930 RepID=A0A1H9QCQ6_9GAMM|nr:sulfatase-like hydrolase/transferase [Halopseudomonas bauzanensis]SER58311.1 Sulfatase [Halopseudomonas bauzanensis]SFL67207.1 Sulfatase [Halopseudomonas bauzanensis]
MSTRHTLLAGLCLLAFTGCKFGSSSSSDTTPVPNTPPNILFIVIDDAGVDQFASFGYGGAQPAQTASIDAIAQAGVRFRNTWSMPTCSPTRSTFFDGRYPFRSGVRNAIVSNDLANSQVSPYTLTTPRLLREQAGYVSALIGKMHLTGSDLNPDNHPLGDDAMRELGWDYFAGYLDGAPYPIDTTAGGVGPEGTYQCGFVPNTTADAAIGADYGVCYLPDGHTGGSHLLMTDPDSYPTPGRTCLELGGILDPRSSAYNPARHAELNFNVQNGHYTGDWKINHADGSNQHLTVDQPGARGYRTTLETDMAIDWIEQTSEQQPNAPWMLSLGYSTLHAPLQPPPASLLPNPDATLSLIGCGTPVAESLTDLGILPVEPIDLADFAQQRAVAQHMLEAVDHEIGRLLVTTGIALQQDDGSLTYNPDSNTVVVITSDNGTYMPTVKLPFDPLRAKGSLYQTGVWVPLIVAGPMVNQSDRDVPHMINSTDLYSLFHEIAGIDASSLPNALQLDAQPVMSYLTEPEQSAIRTSNFTEQGTNISATTPAPCVIPAANTCVQIFPQQGVCEDQSGVWYGPGSDIDPNGFSSCCAVNAYLESQGQPATVLFPQHQSALRNEDFKLVRISRLDCATDTLMSTEEFYEVNESTNPAQLKLDRQDQDLLANTPPDQLTNEQQANFTALRDELTTLLASGIDCPGDGNGDLQVNQTDLDQWTYWSDPAQGGGYSSWYDFNHDGLTDEDDRIIIEANMGNNCRI